MWSTRWLLPWILVSGMGCGPTMYTTHVRPASRAVEEAKEARAPDLAPYEYFYAKAHLDEAKEEAAQANYQDAVRYAKAAEEYGRKARDLARQRLRDMGR